MTVNRHKGSGNRTLSGANSNPPTFAINRVFSSARSSQAPFPEAADPLAASGGPR